jgi:hypothetical protein
MWQPGALSRTVLALIWLVLGLGMITAPIWLGWTRWPAILNGHPAMLIAGMVCGLAGFVAVAWSIGSLTIGGRQDREGDRDHPAHRTPTQVLRRAHWRIILAVPLLVLSFLLLVALVYARPFVATPTATAALRSEKGVRFSDRLGWYELIPVRTNSADEEIKPTTGLVFVPGARVDSRAYAPVLRPLAAAGYLVVVLKEPFGFAILNPDHGQKVIDLHPEMNIGSSEVIRSAAAWRPLWPTATMRSRAWRSSPPILPTRSSGVTSRWFPYRARQTDSRHQLTLRLLGRNCRPAHHLS